jgi:hypothetical protein
MAHVVPPIGVCLPASSTTPHTATLTPEPYSLADEAAQAAPLENPPQASGHPPLASRGHAVPTAPLEPTTPTPHVASAPLLAHRPGPRGLTKLSVIALLHGRCLPPPPALGPHDPPVQPDGAFAKVNKR